MADVLAIISKAQFESLHRGAKLTDQLNIERYVSKNKGLTPLADGGSLYLVTVRPPDEALWLVGVLEAPRFEGDAWVSAPSTTRVTDITALRGRLRFTSGKGIVAKPGALGMSLQTPRTLTPDDAHHLRAALAPSGNKPTRATTSEEPSAPKAHKKPAHKKPATPKKPARKEPTAKTAPPKTPPPTTADASPTAPLFNAALMAPGLPTGHGPTALEHRVIDDVDTLDARHVLSDALLERNDPRGEYLRLALQLDALPRWHGSHDALEQAVHTLEARYGFAWSQAIRAVGSLDEIDPERGAPRFAFRRGAIEVLRGQLIDVVDALEASRDVAPIGTLDVQVKDHHELDRLATSPALGRVRRLTLRMAPHGSGDPTALPRLFAANGWQRLVALELHLHSESPELMRALATLPAAQSLEAFGLHARPLPAGEPGADATASPLLRAPWFRKLKRLSLHQVRLQPEDLAALAELDQLTALTLDDPRALDMLRLIAEGAGSRLTELSLSGQPIQKGHLPGLSSRALAQLRTLELQRVGLNAKTSGAALDACHLPSLRRLSLSGNNLRTRGAAALAASHAFAGVTELDVAGNALGDAGAAALAEAPHMPLLRDLDLGGNSLKEAGMTALAAGPLLAPVRRLNLRGNKFHNAGAIAFASCPSLPELESLSLFYNWMGVKGLRAIVDQLRDARRLDFDENNYGVEPVRALAKSTRITNLRSFSTREADGQWLQAFAESPAAHHLEQLYLSSSDVSERAGAALAKLPSLGLVSLSFCNLAPAAHGALRAKLGPMLRFWPPSRANAT